MRNKAGAERRRIAAHRTYRSIAGGRSSAEENNAMPVSENPSLFEKCRRALIGAPLDPFSSQTRQHIALAAFLAWVGLGADGLSSSCYGPEEAFKALGNHTHLGLFLAVATATTVFVISLAYNQVIELFPTGGGGYRVATSLLGPRAGLMSGAALIVDYVLTISISVASGVDQLFSLLPVAAGDYKLWVEIAIVLTLLMLNVRGVKESIKILLPIFLGFFFTHVLLIAYGVLFHIGSVDQLLPATLDETSQLAHGIGWLAAISLFLRAYSLGGSSYTGIEAVSNNIHVLAEPRVRTGKLTMLYMALSLAFTAGGIVLLYLLWGSQPVEGQTLNAVAFNSIIGSLGWSTGVNKALLLMVLAFEGGLLLIAANTGFLGGPSVMANMAADSWLPHQFRHLSTRLVTQNGVVIMGVGALLILVLSQGKVDYLAVLYSINVFLTFTLSLAGLCVYWWRHKSDDRRWPQRFALSGLGLVMTFGILVVTIIEKFTEGGWVTLLITGMVIGLCVYIHNHYDETKEKLRRVDQLFGSTEISEVENPPPLNPEAPTAVFLVGSSKGGGIHTLLWVQRLFPNHFKNFIFLSARAVDAQSYGGAEELPILQAQAEQSLRYFVSYCHSFGLAATSKLAMGTDRVEELTRLCEETQREFANCVFFTSKLIFERENFITRIFHNQTALALQRRLHLHGMQMVIMPMKI
jgi:amino acid transporter